MKIGVRSKINGHVMGTEGVVLEDGTTVGGISFSHDWLTMQDLCDVQDLLAVGNITIGSNTIIRDSTIWSIRGTIDFAKNNILNSDSDQPVRLEHAVHALRKNGTELTALLPDGYYYIHSVTPELDGRFDEISDELLKDLADIVEVDLPIGSEDKWMVRSITKSVDLENLIQEIESATLYDGFNNIVKDFVDRVNDLSERIEDLYLNGGST